MPLSYLQVELAPSFYKKNPTSSALGKRIVSSGLDLLNSKGYLHFTFKELAEKTKSTEASIYRYFDSKEQFLAYCSGAYWVQLKHRLGMYTLNIPDSKTYFERTLDVLLNELQDEQYMLLANKDFARFRESSRRYGLSILGILSDSKSRDELSADYASLMREVYQFIEDAIEKVLPNSGFKDIIASSILSKTHMQSSKAKFLSEHLSNDQEINAKRVRDFCRFLLRI